jgi:uncharacterized repeat protein (TIGR01451 family)
MKTLRKKYLRLMALSIVSLLLILPFHTAGATDQTLTVGGRVSIELISSDAFFHNTLSLVSPAGATIATNGCQLEPSPGLPGLKLMSEKPSQHGCRVELDADSATAGIQPFAAGTVLRFALYAHQNANPSDDKIWYSDPSLNSDGFDHLRTTAIHPAEFPGRIFQLSWEDLSGGGDQDFNDLVAVVRVNGDSDGDGLWDDWEQFGIDANGDGTIDLDLPNLLPVDLNGDGDTTDPGERTSPNHKDIFLEIDYMDCAVAGGDCAAGDTHSHRPNANVINPVIQAFRNAPVANPDGNPGITLHVDVGNAIPHQNFLNIPNLCFAPGAGIGNFDTVKADPANFGPNNPRRFAFHYALFTHLQISTSTSSGCGELPGNDFQVSMGGFAGGVGTVQEQAGTLMHEFGHNLGLCHGGELDSPTFTQCNLNRKPNYISIMSYRYQLSGIPPTDPDGIGPLTARVDYSPADLVDLNETNLNEPAGIGDGTDTAFFRCPNGTTGSGVGNSALDWNCDGDTIDASISNDINGDGILSILNGFNDWANLKLDFQNSGSFADGEHSLSAKVVEVDYDTYLQEIAPELSVTMTASPNLVVTGSSVKYTITVKNNNPDTAYSVVVTDKLPGTTTFVSCTATVNGVCTGSANNRTIEFASLAGGASATIELVAEVNCPVIDGTPINNTVSVSASMPDPDPSNNSASATVIASNLPPVISMPIVDKPILWPPNHKMVDVTVSYSVVDNCGPLTTTISITSNQPINGLGDGDTAPDWEVVDAHHVRLRAERGNSGVGRTYTIAITVTDSSGNRSTRIVIVSVPRSPKK